MQKIPQIAGSLNALLVFEAAARLGSFSLAAQELNLSQPAVSRHVATLEARLDCALFTRSHNRVRPTEAGQKLAAAVALGFGHVAAAWSGIAARSGPDEVVLACSYGFADQWLLPRFSRLRDAMGQTQVRVVTSDRMEDLDFGRVDAAVVWNPDALPDRPSIPLIRDETFAVCSPGFRARHAREGSEHLDLQELPPERLLHFSVSGTDFLTWPRYFQAAGLPPRPFGSPAEFNAYPFLMHAVLNGEGVALGWRGLVDELLAQGAVVQAGPSVSSRGHSYYLQHRPLGDSSGALARLRDWFALQAGL
jgi:DNA-binding transcriptional LysR family regulator